MTRTEELQAALDALIRMIENGSYPQSIEAHLGTIRAVLEHAVAKASVTCIEREELTAYIQKRIDTYTHKHDNEGGSDQTKAELRFAIEALKMVQRKDEAARWVSKNAGKPVNHSTDGGNMGWQPIETAPKDCETKALYGCYKDDKWYTQITARGKGVGGLHVNIPTGFRSYSGATHWMPLPAAPKAGE